MRMNDGTHEYGSEVRLVVMVLLSIAAIALSIAAGQG